MDRDPDLRPTHSRRHRPPALLRWWTASGLARAPPERWRPPAESAQEQIMWCRRPPQGLC